MNVGSSLQQQVDYVHLAFPTSMMEGCHPELVARFEIRSVVEQKCRLRMRSFSPIRLLSKYFFEAISHIALLLAHHIFVPSKCSYLKRRNSVVVSGINQNSLLFDQSHDIKWRHFYHWTWIRKKLCSYSPRKRLGAAPFYPLPRDHVRRRPPVRSSPGKGWWTL